MYCDIFDGLALSDVLSDPVNPKPFRLFAVGENALTKNGKKYVLTLSAEQIRSIAEYHRDKGEKIPLDSRHALLLAAEKAGVSETEAAKAVPSKAAALCGYQNQLYFSNDFRKHTGCSPRTFRRRIQENADAAQLSGSPAEFCD